MGHYSEFTEIEAEQTAIEKENLQKLEDLVQNCFNLQKKNSEMMKNLEANKKTPFKFTISSNEVKRSKLHGLKKRGRKRKNDWEVEKVPNIKEFLRDEV